MIETYFRHLEEVIAASELVVSSSLTFDKRSSYVGFVRGELYFSDGSCLHLREFVNVEAGTDRYMYTFNYQAEDNSLIIRYDNTPHYPQLENFPHHKHDTVENAVVTAQSPDLKQVMDEIRTLLIQSI